MERHFYDTGSLSRALILFEERYRLSSGDFYEGHKTDAESVSHVPGFERHLWASFHREVRESGDGDFVAAVERTLQHA